MNLLKLKNIKLTKKSFIKNGSKWTFKDQTKENITGQQYLNIIGAKKFFQNLGGIERHTKNYTKYGYIVIEVSSISPDRTKQILYSFDFDTAIYKLI